MMEKFDPKETLNELGEKPETQDSESTNFISDYVMKQAESFANAKLGIATILTIEQMPTEDDQSVLGMGLEDFGKLLKRNFARVGQTTIAENAINGFSLHIELTVDGKRVKGVIGLPRHPHIVYEESKP